MLEMAASTGSDPLQSQQVGVGIERLASENHLFDIRKLLDESADVNNRS